MIATAIGICHTNSVYRLYIMFVAHAKMVIWIPTLLGTKVDLSPWYNVSWVHTSSHPKR